MSFISIVIYEYTLLVSNRALDRELYCPYYCPFLGWIAISPSPPWFLEWMNDFVEDWSGGAEPNNSTAVDHAARAEVAFKEEQRDNSCSPQEGTIARAI